MAIKIDLEKAYEKIRWEYTKKVVEEIECPEERVNKFMKCINLFVSFPLVRLCDIGNVPVC